MPISKRLDQLAQPKNIIPRKDSKKATGDQIKIPVPKKEKKNKSPTSTKEANKPAVNPDWKLKEEPVEQAEKSKEGNSPVPEHVTVGIKKEKEKKSQIEVAIARVQEDIKDIDELKGQLKSRDQQLQLAEKSQLRRQQLQNLQKLSELLKQDVTIDKNKALELIRKKKEVLHALIGVKHMSMGTDNEIFLKNLWTDTNQQEYDLRLKSEVEVLQQAAPAKQAAEAAAATAAREEAERLAEEKRLAVETEAKGLAVQRRGKEVAKKAAEKARQLHDKKLDKLVLELERAREEKEESLLKKSLIDKEEERLNNPPKKVLKPSKKQLELEGIATEKKRKTESDWTNAPEVDLGVEVTVYLGVDVELEVEQGKEYPVASNSNAILTKIDAIRKKLKLKSEPTNPSGDAESTRKNPDMQQELTEFHKSVGALLTAIETAENAAPAISAIQEQKGEKEKKSKKTTAPTEKQVLAGLEAVNKLLDDPGDKEAQKKLKTFAKNLKMAPKWRKVRNCLLIVGACAVVVGVGLATGGVGLAVGVGVAAGGVALMGAGAGVHYKFSGKDPHNKATAKEAEQVVKKSKKTGHPRKK